MCARLGVCCSHKGLSHWICGKAGSGDIFAFGGAKPSCMLVSPDVPADASAGLHSGSKSANVSRQHLVQLECCHAHHRSPMRLRSAIFQEIKLCNSLALFNTAIMNAGSQPWSAGKPAGENLVLCAVAVSFPWQQHIASAVSPRTMPKHNAERGSSREVLGAPPSPTMPGALVVRRKSLASGIDAMAAPTMGMRGCDASGNQRHPLSCGQPYKITVFA